VLSVWVKGKNPFVFPKELFLQIWRFFSIFPRKRSTKKQKKSVKKAISKVPFFDFKHFFTLNP
jgi:hypothetical protein